MSWSDSSFDTGSQRADDTLAAFLQWHIDWLIEAIKETQLCHRPSGERVWYDGAAGDGVVFPSGKVQPSGAGEVGPELE